MTGTARARDEFLTKRTVSAKLVADMVVGILSAREGVGQSFFFVEPSAGNGSFLDALPTGSGFLALDLHPQDARVEQADFMKWTARSDMGEGLKVVALGNPPFGKNASLALKFVNKCADFADYVAMILPRTFRKTSMKRRLDRRLELLWDTDVEKNAFTFKGKDYDVPCMFAVWFVGNAKPLEKAASLEAAGLVFCKKEDAQISFQRVGVKAGTVRTDFGDRASASHYFLKAGKGETAESLGELISSLDWTDVKHSTAGNPSISKRELVAKFEAARKKRGRAKKR